MAARLTTEGFKIKAIAKHGETYGYTKSVYTGCYDLITITCHVHGDFQQKPSDHLSGKGCKACGIEKNRMRCVSNTQVFIERALLVEHHQGKGYSYVKVNYINALTEVIIICPHHGEFKQRPANHLRGEGCKICSGNFRKTTEQFLEELKTVEEHKDKDYDFSEVVYPKSNKEHVKVTCNTHNYVFFLTPNDLLRGYGCRKCGLDKVRSLNISSKEEFISKSKAVHCYKDSNYNYDKVVYVNSWTKVVVTCLTHGDFEITPAHHVSGGGCTKCYRARQISRGEQEVFDFVKSINSDSSQSDDSVLGGKEIDIIIHSLKIGIEFNGVYNHAFDGRKAGRPKEYHFDKREMANDVGYRLVSIWEDDWKNNKEQQKELLTTILCGKEKFDFTVSEIKINLDHVDVKPYLENGYKLIDIDIEKQKRDKFTVYNSGVATLVKTQ